MIRSSSGIRSRIIIQRCLSYWSSITLAPPDKILGLNDAYKNDTFPKKVSLGVGAYRDNDGKPVVLPSVRTAESRLLSKNLDHEYAGIAGVQSYVNLSLEFAYGNDSEVLKSGKVAAVQSLSGTGACRLAGEFVAKFFGKGKKMYMPDPTWGNHLAIMKNSGLEPASYAYFDSKTCGVDFKGMLNSINNAETGSVFMFHACAHNPTGCDPTLEQWDQLSIVMKAKKHITFFDCAYQGFASGDSEKDAYAIRKFVADGHQILLAQSFAKNFGLYGERVGTLSVVCASKEEKDRVESQLKVLVRPMYSNPPVYGARLIAEILSDQTLRQQWTLECKSMADRILEMRTSLKESLKKSGSTKNWDHITDQIGMFCYTGMSSQQVKRLIEEFHIYCTEDGRISVAGLNSKNVQYVAQSIHEVTK